MSDPIEVQAATDFVNSAGSNEMQRVPYIARAMRGVVLVSKDEINLLRQWITDFKTEVAAASSLADLKTRVAGLSAMPQRTSNQAKNAIISKIADSDAD